MHSFRKYCIDPAALTKKQTLRGFKAAALKQANTPAAQIPYNEVDMYEEDGKKIKAPRYFGAAGELFAQVYLEFFGNDYNLHTVTATDDEEKENNDGGVDLEAMSIKSKIYKKQALTKTDANSSIYIQVKFPLDPTKEHMTNDGSRIMNFFGNAQGLARTSSQCYQARYFLVTFGKGLQYRLNDNTSGLIFVINFKEMARKVDNNPAFWNAMNTAFGLPTNPILPSRIDPEMESILAEVGIA